MFNLINYEKLSNLVLKVYRVPKSHFNEFEPLFWTNLAVLAGLLFVPAFLPENGVFSSLLNLLFIIAQVFVMIPFAVGVIQKFSSKKKPTTPYIKSIAEEGGVLYVKKTWQAIAIVAGASVASFIPAGLSSLMIEMGATSNIFTGFSSLLFLGGGAISIYTLLRFCPKFIYAARGEEVSLQSAFEKSHGHVLSIFYVLLLTTIPVWIATSILSFALHNVILGMDNICVTLGIEAIKSVVRAAGYLTMSYLTFGALTDYMINSKIIKKEK